MKGQPRTGDFWLLILGVNVLACGSTRTASAQEPPQQPAQVQTGSQSPQEEPFTAAQQERLKQRDRLWNEAQQSRVEGKLDEAAERLEQIETIEEKLFGKSGAEVAAAWQQLGHLHVQRDDLDAADEAWRKVLRIQTALYPQGHPDLATSLNNLGALLECQGEYDTARGYFQQALAICQQLYSDDQHPQVRADLPVRLRKLGFLLESEGEYGAARGFSEQARVMRSGRYLEEQYGQGHPDSLIWLHNSASLAHSQGDYRAARRYCEEAHAICEGLYPDDQYPHGHPTLAWSLDNLGLVLSRQGDYRAARGYYEQALVIYQRLCRERQFPAAHPAPAMSLCNLGYLLWNEGDYGGARGYFEQALAMYQRLYPEAHFPQGHPNLAASLNNLGSLLASQGEYAQARRYYEQAHAMNQRLYPDDQYPQGHANLAASLNNLGYLLASQGGHAQAWPYFQQAHAMNRRLYPDQQYPQGHRGLAVSLINLGDLLRSQGEYRTARDYLEQALAMCQQLYPDGQYPQGHRDLVGILNNLGDLLHSQGDYSAARKYYQRALAMSQRLYPEAQFPQGHSALATSLNNLGHLLASSGEYGAARRYCEQALAMRQRLEELFLATASEAEAFQFTAAQPLTQDALLSVCRQLPERSDEVYRHVWRGRRAIHRIVARRQDLLNTITDPNTQTLYEDYLQARRDLARLALAPAEPEPKRAEARAQRLRELGEQKEALERQLAASLPEFRRQLETARTTPEDLLAKLPDGTAFVDLVGYTLFAQDPDVPGKKGERRTPSYAAFVLRPGAAIVRVELGPAEPIDQAVDQWRGMIAGEDQKPGSSKKPGFSKTPEQTLRNLLWEPLEAALGPDTRAVFLCPDGRLTALPWVALPGREPNSFLVEDYAVAVVPHGQFLLQCLEGGEQRAEGREPSADSGLLLAVGDVAFDAQAQERVPKQVQLALRGAVRSDDQLHWGPLPGTRAELEGVIGLCARRSRPRETSGRGESPSETGPRTLASSATGIRVPGNYVRLDDTVASTARVLTELPRASYAHIATHGFFADPKIRSVLQPDLRAHERRLMGLTDQVPASVGRNPLVLSGLVLAGANLPRPTNEWGIPEGDGGILTAEAIAGLPLRNLDLATLSACETGLGQVAGGEGVFGLQRAFHIGGAHTVVASLWKVDDAATQPLMTRFYTNLWQKKMGKLEALREAQLALLDRQLDFGSSSAAPNGEGDQSRAPGAPVIADHQPTSGRVDPYYWAAWVMSGDPGDLSFLTREQPPPSGVAQVTGERPGTETETVPSATGANTDLLLIITATILAAVVVLAAVLIGFRTRRQRHR